MRSDPGRARGAFTLIELLISIAVIGVLIGLLLPALGSARGAARDARCLSNMRQLVMGWTLYAGDYRDLSMPAAYTGPDIAGDSVYWWGAAGNISEFVDPRQGLLTPYLSKNLGERSVYECPSQPWGSYLAQGTPRTITSTYGYNGYYLSPEHTPGWSSSIGHRPWRRLADLRRPTELLVFADTMLPGEPMVNSALLDPPMLYQGRGRWRQNHAPTTSFRHGRAEGAASGARADGSAAMHRADPEWLTHPRQRIGSVGTENGPWYVPDWEAWR